MSHIKQRALLVVSQILLVLYVYHTAVVYELLSDLVSLSHYTLGDCMHPSGVIDNVTGKVGNFVSQDHTSSHFS